MVGLTRTIRSPLPIALSRTLGAVRVGLGDPTMLVRDDDLWRASHTPEGPATIHLRSVDALTVDATAWGRGAAWLVDRADWLIGARDSLEGFDPGRHPAVARAIHKVPGLRIGATGLVHDTLVPAILGQKVTVAQAKKAWRMLVHLYGTPAPGPDLSALRPSGLKLPPTAAQIAAMPYWAWHPMGVERRRADVIALATARIDRLQDAATMAPEAADRRLQAIRGIGPWTAGLIRRVSFGDPDAVQLADFHIPNTIAWNLAGEPRGDDARMLELLAPFAGHRGRVVLLVKHALGGAPKRGPRMSIHAVEDL